MEISVENPVDVVDFSSLDDGDVFIKNERPWIKVRQGTDDNPVVAVALDNGDLLRSAELNGEDDVKYRPDAVIQFSAPL